MPEYDLDRLNRIPEATTPRVVEPPSEVEQPDDDQERDPNGFDAHTPGAKLDAGKPQMGLVLEGFPRALLAVGIVATFGAEKYTPNGWMSVPDGVKRYTDAMIRHQLAEAYEGITDPSTDLRHDAQVAWNALARLELRLRDEDNER